MHVHVRWIYTMHIKWNTMHVLQLMLRIHYVSTCTVAMGTCTLIMRLNLYTMHMGTLHIYLYSYYGNTDHDFVCHVCGTLHIHSYYGDISTLNLYNHAYGNRMLCVNQYYGSETLYMYLYVCTVTMAMGILNLYTMHAYGNAIC